MRTALAITIMAVLSTALLANPSSPRIKTGDIVAVSLTGEAAQKFAERTLPRVPPGVQMELIGVVAQVAADGRVRIEHSTQVKREGKAEQLVTLAMNVDKSQIAMRTIPAGTQVFSSPADSSPTRTTDDSGILTLEISTLTGLKLRTWTLADEICG